MVIVKSKYDSRAKHEAISGRWSEYSGFKLTEKGSVSSVENDCCMTCQVVINPSHTTDLTLR